VHGTPAPHQDVSDRDLIIRSQAGDEAAFGDLVTRYMRRAYFAALGLVGSHDDALDLSQAAFVRAYRARERIDPERPFYAWLYQIIRRLCFNHVRDGRTRARSIERATPWLEDQAQARAAATNPQHVAERHELRLQQLMMAALDNELVDRERREFEELLQRDDNARAEWERMRSVQEVTQTMSYSAPADRIWQEYWGSVYSRIERGLSWILISIGAIVLLSYGGWQAVNELIDAEMPVAVKVGVFALLVGFVILLVSVIREKVFMQRRNPYKDVTK